ncbi:MAG: ArsR family transcriptional regulator [Halodesulfurarchaeum sp.]
MAGRERNEHGQYADTIPPEQVLSVFERREDRARPLTANDVMEALDCSRRTAHDKLNELVERGILETRKVGARSRVWWIPIRRESTDSREEDRAAAVREDRPLAVEQRVQQMELPGSGPRLEERREAILAAFDYLREHPEAKKSDFLADVYPEHAAGFDTPEGWWNVVQRALKQLPHVDPPKERGHIWHFLGG